jgi:hypothetical protein
VVFKYSENQNYGSVGLLMAMYLIGYNGKASPTSIIVLSYNITMFFNYGEWNLFPLRNTDFLYWLGGIGLFIIIDFVIIFIKKEYKIKESKHVQ